MGERLGEVLHRPRNGAVWVAEASAGEVIGWLHVSATPLLEVPLRAEVNGLVVDEKQRSLGAGAKLLEVAERWAAAKGCESMSVRSNVVPQRAHRFYLHHCTETFTTHKAFRHSL